MPRRPIVSKVAQADLERRIAKLEHTVEQLAQAISVSPNGNVTIKATDLTFTAGMVNLNTAMTKASDVIQCQTIIATSVVSESYTPGAGNIW